MKEGDLVQLYQLDRYSHFGQLGINLEVRLATLCVKALSFWKHESYLYSCLFSDISFRDEFTG